MFPVRNWFEFPKDVSKSALEEDKLDLPTNGASWLKYFKMLNKLTLDQYDVSNKWNVSYSDVLYVIVLYK